MAWGRKKASADDAYDSSGFADTLSSRDRDERGTSLLTIATGLIVLAAMGGLGWTHLQGAATLDRLANQNRIYWAPRPGHEADFMVSVPLSPVEQTSPEPPSTAPADFAPPPNDAVEPASEPPASLPIEDSTPVEPDPPPPPVETPAEKNDKLDQTLLPAPAAGLTETVQGIMGVPRIATDGRLPWQAYARPFDQADQRPRVVVVLAEMGLSREMTQGAIDHLHPAITLALLPYAPNIAELAGSARGAGHEVLVAMPMQPLDFPRNDAGPGSLLSTLEPRENISRLQRALSLVPGAIGVMPFMGQAFLTQQPFYVPILQELKARGLLYLDPRDAQNTAPTAVPMMLKTMQVPRTMATRWLDTQPSRDAVIAALGRLEDEARTGGISVGLARPYPVVLQILKDWAPSLSSKGIALAPLSAIADLQPDP